MITKRDSGSYTEYHARCRCTAEGAPVTRGQERGGKENSKLGFIGQQTNEYSGQPRPPLHKSERESNERSGEKPVCPSWIFSVTTNGVIATITAVIRGMIA